MIGKKLLFAGREVEIVRVTDVHAWCKNRESSMMVAGEWISKDSEFPLDLDYVKMKLEKYDYQDVPQ